MDKDKKEIRFFVSKKLHEKLKRNADELDIPLASYIKSKVLKIK